MSAHRAVWIQTFFLHRKKPIQFVATLEHMANTLHGGFTNTGTSILIRVVVSDHLAQT